MPPLDYGASSDVGAVRAQNEDSVFTSAAVFAVADGMGGHAAGEVASRLAVESIAELAERGATSEQDVIAAIAAANEAIVASGIEHDEQAGMGTTLTGVALVPIDGVEQWVVFNVGDSRVYHYAAGTLRQISVDHSEVEELLAAGHITPEQAKHYPRRNVVTRSLGSLPAPAPDVWLITPQPGERFLVCSDGLTLEVDDATLAAVLGSDLEAQEAADDLVARAVTAGGRDNVSVVVVDNRP